MCSILYSKFMYRNDDNDLFVSYCTIKFIGPFFWNSCELVEHMHSLFEKYFLQSPNAKYKVLWIKVMFHRSIKNLLYLLLQLLFAASELSFFINPVMRSHNLFERNIYLSRLQNQKREKIWRFHTIDLSSILSKSRLKIRINDRFNYICFRWSKLIYGNNIRKYRNMYISKTNIKLSI